MAKNERLAQFIGILKDEKFLLDENATFLDLGCGNGSIVQELRILGFVAYGCDIKFKDGPYREELQRNGIIKEIDLSDYKIPFETGFFDFVISDQVFEHVQDYTTTIKEMSRVMKSTGACLHIFPSRYSLREPHFKVPFGTIIRSKTWYKFWAYFGARRPSQKGMSPEEIARANMIWVHDYTNYLPHSEITHFFRKQFSQVKFVERTFLKHSIKGKWYYHICRIFPPASLPYRIFKSNVLLAYHKLKN
jgi:SAM-dependent methyltransferase